RAMTSSGLSQNSWHIILRKHLPPHTLDWFDSLEIEASTNIDPWKNIFFPCIFELFCEPQEIHEQRLEDDFKRFRQGLKSVREYAMIFEAKCRTLKMPLTGEEKIKRFINGLNLKIQEKLILVEFNSMTKVLQAALKVEGITMLSTNIKNKKNEKNEKINFEKKITNEKIKVNGSCFYCGHVGHRVSECRIKQTDISNGLQREKHPNFEKNKEKTSNKTKTTNYPRNEKTHSLSSVNMHNKNKTSFNLASMFSSTISDYYGPIGNGFIDETPVTFLVDTGAASTFIARAIVQATKLKIQTMPPIKTRTATGNETTTIEKTQIPLQIGKDILTINAFVLENLSYDIIIGYDTLTQYKATIDATTNTVSLRLNNGRVSLPISVSISPITFTELQAIENVLQPSETLEENQMKKIKELLNEFQDIIPTNEKAPPQAKGILLHIRTGDAEP
ncbi:hypothetical protein HMI54_012269, partial [Coelomomyces lativittatus]